MTDQNNRCIAINISGNQCLRIRNKNSEYCGTHGKCLAPDAKKKIEIQSVRGIPYFIDGQNHVYKHEEMQLTHPSVIGTFCRDTKKIKFL